MISAFSKSKLKTVLVRGVTEIDSKEEQLGNLTIISYANAKQMEALISSSSIVFSRPGYSTIMDLAVMQKQAVFIPTPGQTEQEYLGEHYKRQNLFYSVSQNDFNLAVALEEIKKYKPLKIELNKTLLTNAIKELLNG